MGYRMGKWKNNKEKLSLRYKEWYRKNGRKRDPAKVEAHSLVASAIRFGTIIRPDECSLCGLGGRIEGHHNDYSKPLDVMWFCNRCHRKLHTGY